MNHRIGWVCVGVLFLLSATACGTSSSSSDVVEDSAQEDSQTDRSVEDLWVPDGTNDKGGQDQQVPEDTQDITEPDTHEADEIEGEDLFDIPDLAGDTELEDVEEVEDDETTPECIDTDPNPCVGAALNLNGQCVPVDLSDVPCDDGLACTTNDTCSLGACAGASYQCDDGNDCTDDLCLGDGTCNFPNNALPCDDSDPCTVTDQCLLGSCTGTSSDCECKTDGDCGVLEDQNLCNGTLVCDKEQIPYLCQVDPATVKVCPQATGPNAECLVANCDPGTGACGLAPANEWDPCDDGLFCSEVSVCQNGVCTATKPNCNDENECSSDSCDEELNTCNHTPVEGECFDEDFCTSGDYCQNMECQPGAPVVCQDDNVCTDNLCDPGSGCHYPPIDAECSDDDLCTDGDHCLAGECISGTPLVCNDNVACTVNECYPETGCVFITDNSKCYDGDVCTVGDYCTESGCESLNFAACPVGPAGSAVCNPYFGCVLTSVTGCQSGTTEPTEECDDGNADAGDGCNPNCRAEDQVLIPIGAASDFDVDGVGNLIVVGLAQASGAVLQCYNSGMGLTVAPLVWYAADASTNVSSEEPRVVRAANSGVSLVGWRHLTVANDWTSVRLDVRYIGPDCQPISPPVRLFDHFIPEFWDLDMDDNGYGAVAFIDGTNAYLHLFNPDGTYKVPSMALPGSQCKDSVHVSLSPLGNGGVVSCQGNELGVVFWTFDANGNLTKVAEPMPGAAGATAWYDSHNVYVAPGGQFALVNAHPSGMVFGAFYDAQGNLIIAMPLMPNLNPPPACYDMYRFGNIKNVLSNGKYVISLVANGDCFATDHTNILIVNPNTASVDYIIQDSLPLQTIALDRYNSSYMFNSADRVMKNFLWIP